MIGFRKFTMYKVDLKRLYKNKKVSRLIALHIVVFVLIGALIFIKSPCPFKSIFGIPCPACGTLHALSSIIHGDLYGYIHHNYLALPMILAFWFGIHNKSMFNNSRCVDFFIYFVCGLVVIRYFLKIFVDFL